MDDTQARGPEPEREDLLSRVEGLMETMKDWERGPVVQVGNVIVEIVKLPKKEGRA